MRATSPTPAHGRHRDGRLLDSIPGTVYTTGDNVYDSGTAAEFNTYYEPTWGRHKARTNPSPGNHDYNTPGATGYYGYFGARPVRRAGATTPTTSATGTSSR